MQLISHLGSGDGGWQLGCRINLNTFCLFCIPCKDVLKKLLNKGAEQLSKFIYNCFFIIVFNTQLVLVEELCSITLYSRFLLIDCRVYLSRTACLIQSYFSANTLLLSLHLFSFFTVFRSRALPVSHKYFMAFLKLAVP